MIKVAKDLLSMFMKDPNYFYQEDFKIITNKSNLLDINILSNTLYMLEKYKLMKLVSKMSQLK